MNKNKFKSVLNNLYNKVLQAVTPRKRYSFVDKYKVKGIDKYTYVMKVSDNEEIQNSITNIHGKFYTVSYRRTSKNLYGTVIETSLIIVTIKRIFNLFDIYIYE